MRKFLFLFLAAGFSVSVHAQHVVLKNNLLYDATTTPNLALEIGLGRKTTLDLYGGYNPFNFKDNKKFKHWLAQPEIRFWSCERFNGLFWGIHVHGGEFNLSAIDMPFGIFKTLKDHRYQGHFYGAGVSVGNQWVLGNRWNFELSIGAGYARYSYEKYPCQKCSPLIKKGDKNYFGPTKATVSFIYVIR